MLYFSTAPVRLDSVDEQQYNALKKFKQECYGKGLVESYETLSEFRDKFLRQLSQTIIQTYLSTESVVSAPASPLGVPIAPQLSPEAKQLLLEAGTDPNGHLLRIRHLGGMYVSTNGQKFAVEGDPRSEALWEGVVRELRSSN